MGAPEGNICVHGLKLGPAQPNERGKKKKGDGSFFPAQNAHPELCLRLRVTNPNLELSLLKNLAPGVAQSWFFRLFFTGNLQLELFV